MKWILLLLLSLPVALNGQTVNQQKIYKELKAKAGTRWNVVNYGDAIILEYRDTLAVQVFTNIMDHFFVIPENAFLVDSLTNRYRTEDTTNTRALFRIILYHQARKRKWKASIKRSLAKQRNIIFYNGHVYQLNSYLTNFLGKSFWGSNGVLSEEDKKRVKKAIADLFLDYKKEAMDYEALF